MNPSWLSIAPPLIVLVSVCITRRLYLSLIFGIISAALIATRGIPLEAAHLLNTRIVQQITDKDNIYIYLFIIIIGSLITLICATGGIYAFTYTLQKKFTNKRTAETSSFILSILVGIDDYLNSLTVGHIMQPIADKFGIARTKLAYLIHSMASPLVILIPISSWAAVITNNLELAGISLKNTNHTKILAEPFFVYLKSLPFIFYSILTIFSVWYIIRKQLSFGPMYQHEQRAKQHTTTSDIEQEKQSDIVNSYSLLDIIIPLVTLLITVIVGILYTGGYYLFGGTYNLVDALKNNTENPFVLFSASLITFIVTLFLGVSRKKVKITALPALIKDGTILMGPSLLMLFFASILGLLLRYDLETGTYLAHTVIGNLPITLMPLVFFIISAIVALIIGSSWGTIAIMLPIAVPMLLSLLSVPLPAALSTIPLLLPTLGALFSGAVSGNHLSPISETTTMAATSSGTTPFDHAYTQFPYAIPALIASALAFLISGLLIAWPLWLNLVISLGTGLTLCIFILHNMNRKWKSPLSMK